MLLLTTYLGLSLTNRLTPYAKTKLLSEITTINFFTNFFQMSRIKPTQMKISFQNLKRKKKKEKRKKFGSKHV